MRVSIVRGDLTAGFAARAVASGRVAWDVETTGLDWQNNRIATCQLHIPGYGTEILQVSPEFPFRLMDLIISPTLQKVFHHAAFDLRFMQKQWNCLPNNVACTKVLSKILDPDGASDNHSLKYLVQRHLNVHLDKTFQTSDWTLPVLGEKQIAYAAADVEYLLPLLDSLYASAVGSGLKSVVDASFAYLPSRVETDLRGCGDIFSY